MNKSLHWIIGLALSLQFTHAYPAPQSNDSANQRHTQAIEKARAGKLDEALAELANLHQQFPERVEITADYAIVLTWANRRQEALQLFSSTNLDSWPTYALAPMAKAARDANDFNQSLAIYDKLIQRNPSVSDYQIAHALVLVDARQFDQANNEIDLLRTKFPQNSDVLHTQIYLGQQSVSPIKVIDACQRLLALDSNNQPVINTLITAAREVGATTIATEMAAQHHVDQQVLKRTKADIAASKIRWGELEPMDSRLLYVETDNALQSLDIACQCDWNTLDVNDPTSRQLGFDRMLALYHRHRYPEVISLYKRFLQEHIEVPDYAKRVAGGAFLELKKPEQSIAIYDEMLLKTPNDSDILLDKFSALIDLERFDEALEIAKRVAKQEPSYLQRINNPVIRENLRKLQADTKSALGRQYGDQLADSEQQFQALHHIGPENAAVRNNLGTVWRWRGWLDKSAQAFNKNLEDDNDDEDARFGLANTYLDGRDWKLANTETETLSHFISAEDPVMKALNRRWELHNRRELVVDFNSTRFSGNAIGSKSGDVSARLYSAPFNDNYRAFVSTNYDRGTFTEGNGYLFAPDVGLEYRSHQWLASAQVSTLTGSDEGVAAAATAEYRLDDYWRFNGDIALNSTQVPLRARRIGIHGDSIGIGATYRWSELMQASMMASFLNMSDGNNRESLEARWDRRLYTAPHYKANVRLNLAFSNNTADNTVYFNPRNDTSYSVTLLQEWVTWRRYERSFTQKMAASIGGYSQAGFGNQSTWSVSYSHLWSFDRELDIEYGIMHIRRPYDGVMETGNSLFGHLNLLF